MSVQRFIDDKAAHPDHEVLAPRVVLARPFDEAVTDTLDGARKLAAWRGAEVPRGVIVRARLADGRCVRVQITEEPDE